MRTNTEDLEWVKYEANGTGHVHLKDWGKDHWSTFAYAVACVTGEDGKLENSRMRTNSRIHRELVFVTPFGTLVDGASYPTILKLGKLERHDDWSCLEDAVAAGLLNVFYARTNDKMFGCCEAKVEMTTAGWEIARKLAEHKASGKNFSDFEI
mgnify:CR=1 FL=1